MSDYKILLINPPQLNSLPIGIEDEFIDIIGYYPPLGLLYLATVLKNSGYQTKIIDCVPLKIGYSELETEIKAYHPDMVGVTTYTTEMVDVLTTVNLVKSVNSEIVTVLGGHHPVLYPNESVNYQNVDYIIRGEGELSLLQLVQLLEKNAPVNEYEDIDGIGFLRNGVTYLNPSVAYIGELDSLPYPDRSLLPFDIYKSIVGRNDMLATMMSSRGCPFRCTFCYTPNKKYRSRSVENIINEVKYLVNLGFKEIFFFDDLFALKSEKVIEFSRKLREYNIMIDWSFRARVSTITEEMVKEIKSSGVHRIQFGIESGVDKTLKTIRKETNPDMIRTAIKICSEAGITTVGSFIFGLPGETSDDISRSLKFSRSIGLDYAQYNIFMPYPHTEAYLEGLKTGVFSKDYWLEFAQDPIGNAGNFKMEYWTKEVTREFLFVTAKKAFKRFYFRPSLIWKRIKVLKNIYELKASIQGALSVMKFNPKSK